MCKSSLLCHICNLSVNRLISLQSGSSYLLLLQGGTRMPVRGLAEISSLYGTVIAHGYEITPQTPSPVPIYCPIIVSSKCLETDRSEGRELEQTERNALLHTISTLHPDSMTAQEVLAEMKSESVLVLVSKLSHQPSSFITSHVAHKNLYSGGSAKKVILTGDSHSSDNCNKRDRLWQILHWII